MASLDLNDFITIGFISKEENSVLKVQSVKNKKEYALKKIKRFDLKSHLKDIQGILNIIAFDHPNIVKILGFSIIQQKKDCKNEYILCLLMDCYSKNLESDILYRSNQIKPYSKDEFLELIQQIHSILYHLQTNIKMAHRDIKPSNILISNTGTLLLADFSEAYLKTDLKERSTSVVGTPYFMAPEIRELYIKSDFSEGNNYDPWKADVFSMGMTFLDCACLTIAEKGNLNEKFIHLEKLYGKEIRDFVEVCVGRESIDRMDFEELSQCKEYEKILGKFSPAKKESCIEEIKESSITEELEEIYKTISLKILAETESTNNFMELMKKIQRIEYENKEMMEFLSNTSEKKTSITSLSTLSMGSNSYDSNCIKFMQNRNIFSNNTH